MQRTAAGKMSFTGKSNNNRCRFDTKYAQGYGTNKKNYGSSRGRNSFLNTRILPKNPKQIIRVWNDLDYNLLTQKNYEYLRESVFQYASLLNKKVNYKESKYISKNILMLQSELVKLLGKDINISLEYNKDALYFNLYKPHDWGGLYFCWYPVKFIQSLNEDLKKITMAFFHQFAQSNGLSTINETDDLALSLDWIEGDMDSYSEEERENTLSLIDSYNNEINEFLGDIERTDFDIKLSTALNEYIPTNDFEKALVGLMIEGMEFIGKDKPSIMSFAYNPYYEENQDYYPIELSQQIRIIYDSEDYVTEILKELYEMQLQETYEISIVTSMELTPESNRLFVMNDYPTLFLNWSCKFLKLLETHNNE